MSNSGNIRVNLSSAVNRIKKFQDQLSGREIKRGISKAINGTLREGREKTKEVIRSTYKIPAKYLDTVGIETANESKLTGGIGADPKPLPLSLFKPRYFPGSSKGVSFEVKNRSSIKFAFMIPGLPHVFGRGHYLSGPPYGFILERKGKKSGKNNGDVRRKNRRKKTNYQYPLTRLITVSVSGAMNNIKNKKKIENFIERELPKNIIEELQRRVAKASR